MIIKKAEEISDNLEKAKSYRAGVLPIMTELRSYVDAAETVIPDEYLPYPTYGKILFTTR